MAHNGHETDLDQGEIVHPAMRATLASLREEIEGLRTAAQLRAVIEQAKGILVERHGISLEEAFLRLRAMSQQYNVRLVEVAATIVGVAVPSPPDVAAILPEEDLRGRLPTSSASSTLWRVMQQEPEVRSGVLTALVDTLAGSTSDGDEAARLILDMLAAYRVSAIMIYRLAADGSLRLIGQHGVPGDIVSSWRSIPPSHDIAYVRCVRDDEVMFWRDRAARHADFPERATIGSAFEATANIPLSDGGVVVGVVGLMWSTPEDLGDDGIASIAWTVRRFATVMLRDLLASDPELEWLHAVLGVQLEHWLLLAPAPAPEGHMSDFVVEAAGPPVSADGWRGRRLFEMWPSVIEDGTARSLNELLRIGGSWTTTVVTRSEPPWGIPGSRVRAVRLGRRLALVWRPGRSTERRAGEPGSEVAPAQRPRDA